MTTPDVAARSAPALFASMILTASAGLMAVALTVIAPTNPAAAQEVSDEARARAHHEAGLSYFDQGRYGEAATQFQEAYNLSGRAHLLLNVSRAQELSGDPAGAANAIETFLNQEPDADSRVTLTTRMNELRERAESAVAPSSEDSPSSPAIASEEPPQERAFVGPVVLFSVAGASLLAAIGTGAAALDLHGTVSDQCDDDGRCPPSSQGDIDAGFALALSSDILFATSALLATGGFLWWLLSGESSEDAAAAEVFPICGPEGCSVQAAASF